MFARILIANRGEIACRVMRTARRLGIQCVAVYSDADCRAQHVLYADQAYRLGPPAAAESYLNIDAVIEAARHSGSDAIHPGYGFLSENPVLVEACEAAGIVFIGPPAAAIRLMGLKDAAKQRMQQAGVPVVPGYHGGEQDAGYLAERAAEIGYPVLIKARAGGGGKGMRRVERAEDFDAALQAARREAEAGFGDPRVLIEKYLDKPRHVEVQVFADGERAVYLFERDCSLQRRHQKVIEEAPAPGMGEAMRRAMGEAAVAAAEAVGYRGAGTVEFIADASDGLRADRFFFMEMNTRLQVEHPVTELIAGVDLVEWQLKVAAGEPLPLSQDRLTIDGHAFEARIYAEDPDKGFLPATGTLTRLRLPHALARVDAGVCEGDAVTPFYDPLIAKLIVHGPTRALALNKLGVALAATQIAGCTTNVGFLARLAALPEFIAGDVDTHLIERRLEQLLDDGEPPPPVLAAAALAVLGLLTERSLEADPWQDCSGWRLWDEATQTARLSWRGEQREVPVKFTADGLRVGSERPLRVQSLTATDGELRLVCEGRIVRAAVSREPAALTVIHAGQSYRFDIPDPLLGAAEAGTGGDQLRAPMPGVVRVVKVMPGDTVEQGQPALVLEAMKMELTLNAPAGGVVAETVAVGEQVAEGALLLRLKSDGGE